MLNPERSTCARRCRILYDMNEWLHNGNLTIGGKTSSSIISRKVNGYSCLANWQCLHEQFTCHKALSRLELKLWWRPKCRHEDCVLRLFVASKWQCSTRTNLFNVQQKLLTFQNYRLWCIYFTWLFWKQFSFGLLLHVKWRKWRQCPKTSTTPWLYVWYTFLGLLIFLCIALLRISFIYFHIFSYPSQNLLIRSL